MSLYQPVLLLYHQFGNTVALTPDDKLTCSGVAYALTLQVEIFCSSSVIVCFNIIDAGIFYP